MNDSTIDRECCPTEEVPPPTVTEYSYGQILRSSSIIGGAQLINMVIGLVRTKLVAILIGPSGIGLLGIFQSITGLASTVAGLGIQTSGVRDMAKFHGAEDHLGVARTVTTLQRVSWFTGVAGMLLLMLLAPQISVISFGSHDYTWSIIALGVTVLLANVAGGQGAVIQGTRRIGDLARISILSAPFGTLIAVGFYAWLGVDGIVPSLVVMSIVSLGISTYYARKINITKVKTSWQDSWKQSGTMIKFGLSMVASGVVGAVVTYLTRVLIIREFDLTAAGIFTAAFSLSGMFVQFVLGAMGADFYPRLTAISHDHPRMNQLINEQTEIGLLLAFPGLLGTLVLAPYALTVFYTKEFASAGDMLTWFIIGCMGRVVSWPLGFSLLAKGQGGLFMATETVFQILHLGLIWIGIRTVGLVGASVAFAILYLSYTIGMIFLTRQTIGFAWSTNVWYQIVWMTPLGTTVLLVLAFLPQSIAVPIGLTISVASGIQCLRQLTLRLGRDHKIARTIQLIPGGDYLLRGLWQT
jgi:antigen flippase